jgi:hypothetical protein
LRWSELFRCAAVIGSGIASGAVAQGPTAADVMQSAREIVATLEQGGGCDLAIYGTPQLDDLTRRWLIAYSAAVGPACDETSAALQRVGLTAEIAFFRRPNSDEVRAEIGKIRTVVRRGFDCLIAFNGEPRFDEESSFWTVRYSTSGHQCGDAGEELERQGKALRIAFHRLR